VRQTAEALLISALINSHDAGLGQQHGIEPEMFVGFQTEYRWVLSYAATYGRCPAQDALLSKFPEFPFSDTTDAAFAADEVRQIADQRNLRSAVREATIYIQEGEYSEAAIALANYTPLAGVKPPSNALWDLSFLTRYAERPDTITLPWKTLQHVTGGMGKGYLWFHAARLGKGKSWGALEVTATALLEGRRVNYWSLEMPHEQVLTRLHVLLGAKLGLPVDHRAMRTRTFDMVAYRKLVNKIRDEVPGELFLFDPSDGACTPATVAARAGDVDLNVIDYIDLMTSTSGKSMMEDWRILAMLSGELKKITIAKDTRMMVLVQVNREGETAKYPPKASNLAGSDAMGRDGDLLTTMTQYSKTSQVNSIEKHRHGDSGARYFNRFLPNDGQLHEISREVADDLRDREDLD
jgi:hypothetical protein